ncbi:MAG TPA: TPM domain-containing protein [Flavobacteriaceae bacterium]|nr:TPM domain-containing protein [Flavobacteriaceae bacterium]
MSANIEEFLTTTEEQDIVEAIRQAEQNTSGEIRVHLENSSHGNIEKRALEVFYILKMENTKLQNAVLIYVAVKDKQFAIYGDKGINSVVPSNFWDSTKNLIAQHFKQGKFKQGLVEGILKAGEQLKLHFPIAKDDINELPNTITKS